MSRIIVMTLAALSLGAATVTAHHGYAAFDREHPATIEGDITQIVFANPHVVLTVHSAATTYSVEWGNLAQMNRTSVTKGILHAGDHVVVTGSVPRDPADHRLSLVTDIRRPADGWRWSHSTPPSASRP